MKYSWKDRVKNYGVLQRALAFGITALIIYLFLPKETLFKFEYQENQPWKHERLYAPFEFAIRKSAEELEVEKARIQETEPLVFSYQDDLTSLVYERLLNVYTSIDSADKICSLEETDAWKTFDRILSVGIIDRGSAPEKFGKQSQLRLLRNGSLKLESKNEFFTITEALKALNGLAPDSCSEQLKEYFPQIIQANIKYNDSLSVKLLEKAINEVLPFEGKIEKGQAIIDRGDIVTEQQLKILESLKAEYNDRTISETGVQWSVFAEVGIAIILLGLLMLFVYLIQDRLFNDPRPITLSLSLVGISFILSSFAHSSDVISMYVIPIGIAPLLLRMFFDFRLSIFTFVVLTLILSVFSSNPLEYILIQISAISFATLYQASNTKRSRILATASLVFIGYSVIYTLVSLAQNGNWAAIETAKYGWFAINAMMCTLVFPLIYIVEKVFGYVSETTLLELSDSNQPLLKELAIKAPGTFQHSLQVANLTEKIASKIGGNTVLLRTSAMYHDIGKMNEPQFFIENQLPDNNPHDELEPEESAAIILGHVSKGIEMARRANLPFDVIQFIRTHHGTSKVQYFLKRAKEKSGEENVNEDDFSYPGPRPKTKEQAILMMADSVEAAARSLKTYDRESIENLVEGIINYQRKEGQFEEAPITFKDLSEAKTVLKNALNSIYHQRISYN